MPNKAISGWTQVPVLAKDITSIHYDRLTEDGLVNQLTVAYNILDSLGAVRQTATLSQQVASYPIAVSVIISAVNTAQGT